MRRPSAPAPGLARGCSAVLAVSLILATAPAATGADDHYKCWKVKDSSRFTATMELAVLHPDLDLDPACKVVGRARIYCAPAEATVTDSSDPGAVLDLPGQGLTDDRLCYKLKCPRGARPGDVDVLDPFGDHRLRGLRPVMVCTNAATLGDLSYIGAFRVPAAEFGISSLNYSEGPIAYDAADDSVYLVGHTYQQAVIEFAVPTLVGGSMLGDLAMAATPLQTFTSMLDRPPYQDADNILNRIGGLALVPTGGGASALLVNAYEYYDAPGDNWLTTMVVSDADDMADADVGGFHAFAGGAGHTSGWMSPVPAQWQGALGGPWITGASSGIPIIGRTSVGPSAFAFDPADVVAATASAGAAALPTVRLLDYSLAEPLHADLSNSGLDNTLWTHLSRATYGVVIPATRTYLAIGYSGGHASGVGYKITQDNGNLCGGYCAYEADDYVEDFVRVRSGEIAASAVRPYAWGAFPVPFATNEIGGGSFDEATGHLFLTLQRADDGQGTYANPPLVAVWQLAPAP
jgi:hypothetical protein